MNFLDFMPVLLPLAVWLFLRFPFHTMFFLASLSAAYGFFTIVGIIVRQKNKKVLATKRRENALEAGKPFLKEYYKNFGDFCILNNNVTVRYFAKRKISAKGAGSIKGEAVYITAQSEKNNNEYDEIFNSICLSFDKNTTVYDIKDILNKSGIYVKVQGEEKNKNKVSNTEKKSPEQKEEIQEKSHEEKIKEIKKIEINTASEAEIRSLPGINIVIAKKIIAKRKERGGFDSVEDFIKTMEIKPHFAKKIRELVVIEKKNQEKENKNETGRILDI